MKTTNLVKAIKGASVALGIALFSHMAQAALSPVYTGDLINTAVCLDSTTALDLNPINIGYLSFQTIYSSGIYSATTFTDGRASTASITVATNSNFTIRAATNSITVGTTASLAGVKATDSITIVSTTGLSGQILTVDGRQIHMGTDFAITTPTGTAVNIKTLLNTFPGIVASTESTNIVRATATVAGLVGNNHTMSSSTSALTVASAHFTGGVEQALTNSVITFKGTTYRNGYLWQTTDTSSGTAISIMSLLNNIGGVACSTGGSGGLVVTCTATVSGSAANAFTLSASTVALTVASANFTGGRDTATVTINGVVLTNGSSWATGTTSSATAQNISNAIMASSSLNTIIHSTWSAAGVVTATATVSGTVGNYSLTTNNADSLTVAGFTGGSAINWVVNTPTITVTGHGYPLGVGVLYSTGGAVAITGLTDQTTYYVTPITVNTIKLSTSKANATAGTYVVLASSVANGQHTYTLTPIVLTGSPSWKWQESNDNSSWSDLSVLSVTFASPYTSASTFWDFGQINPHYLRLNFVSPTFGCVNLRAKGNGK